MVDTVHRNKQVIQTINFRILENFDWDKFIGMCCQQENKPYFFYDIYKALQ